MAQSSHASYLGTFNPRVALFMNMTINYQDNPTAEKIADALKPLRDGTIHSTWKPLMRCLSPAGDGDKLTPEQRCVPYWFNIGTPILKELSQDIAKLLDANASADAKKDVRTGLEIPYDTMLNSPHSMQNLQRALYKICATGIHTTKVTTHGNTSENSSYHSLLRLLADSVDNPHLTPLPPPTPTQVTYLSPVTSGKTAESLNELLARGILYYNMERRVFNGIVHQLVTANQDLNTKVVTNHNTVTALQKKIDLAYQVLQAEGNKLRDLTQNYANSKAQTDQSHRHRVAIGIPYLKPFFTMSQRNFVIMMMCFIIMLVVGILVYAFVGRTMLRGDVTAGSA